MDASFLSESTKLGRIPLLASARVPIRSHCTCVCAFAVVPPRIDIFFVACATAAENCLCTSSSPDGRVSSSKKDGLDASRPRIECALSIPAKRYALSEQVQRPLSAHRFTPFVPFRHRDAMAPAAERRSSDAKSAPSVRKVTRSRHGCETCRARKVRCDERPGRCELPCVRSLPRLHFLASALHGNLQQSLHEFVEIHHDGGGASSIRYSGAWAYGSASRIFSFRRPSACLTLTCLRQASTASGWV